MIKIHISLDIIFIHVGNTMKLKDKYRELMREQVKLIQFNAMNVQNKKMNPADAHYQLIFGVECYAAIA